MTRKEALGYIYNMDVVEKDRLVETIGTKIFNELCSIGFITTNLGTRYWMTDLGRRYCLEMFDLVKNYETKN